MKSVSNGFKAIWARKYGRKEVVRVLYKRAYWNGSAFVYETAPTVSGWQELEQGEIPPLRSMTWKLDTPELNEFKSSSFVLGVEDIDRKWIPTAVYPSVFAADNVATLGYQWNLTKFQVQFGYILDDGTKEYTALFTGLLDDFNMDGEEGVTELTLSDFGRLLKEGNAQNVSDTFTLENCDPAVGDGTETEFNTTSVGVGRIDEVEVDGVSMEQGVDYTVSHLNEVGPARISFTVAPGNLDTVKASGLKWKADESIEDLVEMLCDEAGITDRTINAVIYPGGVSSSKTIDSSGDWAAGSRTNIEYLSSPGDIGKQWFLIDKFADGDFTADPVWSQYGSGVTISGGKMVLGGNSTNGPVITTPFDKQSGTVEFKVTRTVGGAFLMMIFPFYGGGGSYGVYINPDGGANANQIGFMDTSRNGVGSGAGTLVAGNEHTVRLTLDASRNAVLYLDGVQVATATFPSYTSSAFEVWNSNPGVTTGESIRLDNIFYSASIEPSEAVSEASAVWVSAEQDLLAAPVSWGQLERTETLNGGTITYETAVSNSSGAGYDAYVAIGGDGTIQSALKRYLKIRVSITPASGSRTSPFCSKLIARYATAGVFLAVANFTSKTCFSAIQRLAQLADYEWGFTGSGSFFFRSKSVSGDAVITLTQEDPIASLSSYRSGVDKVINLARVRYGSGREYEASYGCADAAEASPNSQDTYKLRIRDESITDVLLANDALIALARARSIHDNNHLPKRTFRLDCRFIPHVDLSDIASVSYYNRPRDADPILGDPLQVWGDSGFGQPLNVLARDLPVKLLGITHTFPRNRQDGFKTALECQEVLS